MRRVFSGFADSFVCTAICSDSSSCSVVAMQLSDATGGPHSGGASAPAGAETCRFPKLEECAHFHYERVQLPALQVILQTSMDQSLHSQHTSDEDMKDWYTLQVTCRDECWLIQRSLENFTMLDAQLHQCIYDRKVSHLPEITVDLQDSEELEAFLSSYLHRFCTIVDNSLNCGPILNWFQLDNRGHRLLVPSEESRSINTPAVAAAYSIRKYVSQARDELSLEVGDMISVIDMASPGESVWWRGKRGFQVGFFPQHCVHIIGDKVPRNMPLPPPVVGSLALSPIKPVLRKHGKLITFFRSFILNRPSRRRLKQSGILKERVFGCDLGEHLLNSGHEIPMVLKCCAEFIETHGIVDGIYRLSGVTSNIQKLRNAFDEDRIPNLYTDEILQDIHSVASLLKMYFRELPNPLCTYQLYQSFVSAVQGCTASRNKANDNERLIKMREAVQKLPPPHYRTLEYLMRHLARVAKHGTNTGMTTRNVAIVWAPNLLRCEELEVGGVAALQGVGVQAVVTEFLVCYADLIFSDHLPNLPDTSTTPGGGELVPASPKRSRPKSLAISTPTKLLTLEEARNKHLLSKTDDCNYIEVGGGPKSLPKKYHTVIELPPGSRKRILSKRSSPSGWRSFFSKSRNSSHGNLSKNREISTPGIISTDSSITDSDLCDMKRKLRPVKSAESLTSGQSEPASCEIDVLGPLHCLSKPPGHNRSVSHDSYFDSLQPSTNNSVGSLLDLSEIQLNFELEESEMRIFSEDESLVSSPKLQKDAPRKFLSRARPEDFSSAANSSNPSPKKQPRVVMSPESLSRKRSRLEDQLSDIQYIDCTTPDQNPCTISTTTAQIHQEALIPTSKTRQFEGYQPKNKSPRSSATNRHSLNFEKIEKLNLIPKSQTEMNLGEKLKVPASFSSGFTPTPQTPNYKPLGETSSASTTPVLTPDLNSDFNDYENLDFEPKSPSYENILTTISITYKSPIKTRNSDNIYEDVELNPEKAGVPTTAAELPVQEATQPVLTAFPMPDTPVESPRLSVDDAFELMCSDATFKEELIPQSSTENSLTFDQSSKQSDFYHVENPNDDTNLIRKEDNQKPGKIRRSSTENSLNLSSKQSDFYRVESSNVDINLLEDNSTREKVSRREKLPRSSTETSLNQIDFHNSNSSSRDSFNNDCLPTNRTSQKTSKNPRNSQYFDSSSNQYDFTNIRTPTGVLNSNDFTPEEHSKNKTINSPQNTSKNFTTIEPNRTHFTPNKTSIQNSLNFAEISASNRPDLLNLTSSYDTQTYDSLTSTPLTPFDGNSERNLSKKSLITPTDEMSMSEVAPTTSSFISSDSSDKYTKSPTLSPQISPMSSNSPMTKSSLDLDSPKCQTDKSDKRKSCDDEILDDIYQQVKYFRRSVHEINSLLDSEKINQSNLTKSKSFHFNLNSLNHDFGVKTSENDLGIREFNQSHSKLDQRSLNSLNVEDTNNGEIFENPTLKLKEYFEHSKQKSSKLEKSLENLSCSSNYSKKIDDYSKTYTNSSDPNMKFGSQKLGQISSNPFTKLDNTLKQDNLKLNNSSNYDKSHNYKKSESNESLTKFGHRRTSSEKIKSPNLNDTNSLVKNSNDNLQKLTKSNQVHCSDKQSFNETPSNCLQNSSNENKKSSTIINTNYTQNQEQILSNDYENIQNFDQYTTENTNPDFSSHSTISESNNPISITPIFDSLEAETNIQIYENIDTQINDIPDVTLCPLRGPSLDLPRARMHENEPKKLDIIPDTATNLSVCAKCNDTTPEKKSNVRNLTNKFEVKEDDKIEKVIETPKPKHNYDKDNLPPCLRAKNAKNSIKTRSLDENAFVTEFGRATVSLQRRKSLDDRTSSYINSKLLIEPQKMSTSTIDVRLESQKASKPNLETLISGTEQKLNRERIEKYKEERRNFLREKYRSESFKEDKDKLLLRLKHQKSFKRNEEAETKDESEIKNEQFKSNSESPSERDQEKIQNKIGDTRINHKDTFELKSNSELKQNLESKIVERDNERMKHAESLSSRLSIKETKFELKSSQDVKPNSELRINKSVDAPSKPTKDQYELKSHLDTTASKTTIEQLSGRLSNKDAICKKLPQEALSKFEKDGAVTKSFRKHHSPLMDRKNRPSLKEISDKILDESVDESVILRGPKEDEFLRLRRSENETERRRHTYDLYRERDFDSETNRRTSLENKTPRKEKCSPSYCIKDMKAIFESKSQQ